MSKQERRALCADINNLLDYLEVTLEGCDWCCGGGDQLQASLLRRLRELGGKRNRWHLLFTADPNDTNAGKGW